VPSSLLSMMAGLGAFGFSVLLGMGMEAHCKWVPNVNWFFVNDVQGKQR
jgi:hypothetical protein